MTNGHQAILEADGTFWLATSAEDVECGHLVVAADGRAKVEVTPELYPGFEFEIDSVEPNGTTTSHLTPTPERGPQTLHGLLDNTGGEPVPVSLIQAHATHWSGGAQTFEPLWTLVGAHIAKEAPFQGIRVRVPGIGSASSDALPLADGGTVRMAEGWFEVNGLPPSRYHELGRTVVRPLCTLLTLTSGVTVRPLAVQISSEAGRWWPVHAGPRPVVEETELPRQQLIHPSDLTLEVVATWLGRATALGPLPGAFASVLETDLSVEAQALILTTVAEGLHRVLYPDRHRFSVEHGEIVRNAAVGAVRRVDENKSTADAVNGFLSHVHEVSYATRLQELAGRAEELVPGITGKTARWKALVYETRNRYAHQASADWMGEDDLDRVLTTAQSLRWVLRLLLLDQADVDVELLGQRFADHQQYQFFLTNAAQWRPTVYD